MTCLMRRQTAHRQCTCVAGVLFLVLALASRRLHGDEAQPAFRKNVDASASQFFGEMLRSPSLALPRKKLATRCHALGYERLADVYEASARFLKSGEMGTVLVGKQISWLCPVPPKDVRATQSRIDGKLSPFDRSAVEMAEDILRRTGFSCELISEWSHAYLFSQLAAGGNDEELEEVAVRNLVTLGDDGNVHPSGLEGSAPVYEFLSGYFSLKRDYVTALAMALAAEERLKEGSITGSQDRSSFATQLRSEISSLKKLASAMRQDNGGHR